MSFSKSAFATWSKRLRTALLSLAAVASIYCFAVLCGPNPEVRQEDVREGKAFPRCPYTGALYTPQQLIDIAVEDLIKRIPRCVQKYASLQDFYSANPHCCDLDVSKTYQGDIITDRRLAASGYLIGAVRMHFYCASPQKDLGEYAMGYANVTSCGRLTEPTVASYESKFVGRYPKQRK